MDISLLLRHQSLRIENLIVKTSDRALRARLLDFRVLFDVDRSYSLSRITV